MALSLYPDGLDWRSLPTAIDPGPSGRFRLPYYEKKAAQKIMRYNLTSATPNDTIARAEFRYFFLGANIFFCLLASGDCYAAEHVLQYLRPLDIAFLVCLLPAGHRLEISKMPWLSHIFDDSATYLPGCLTTTLLSFHRCRKQLLSSANGLLLEMAHLSYSYCLDYQFDKIPINHLKITRCCFNPCHDIAAVVNNDKCLFIFCFSAAIRKRNGAILYVYQVPKNKLTKRRMLITNISWSPNGLYLLLETTDAIATLDGVHFSSNHADIKLFKYLASINVIRQLSIPNYIRCQTPTQTASCWLSNDSFFVTRRFTYDTKLLKITISKSSIDETLLIHSLDTLTHFYFIVYPPFPASSHLEVEYITSLVYSSGLPDCIFYVTPCLGSVNDFDRTAHPHNCLIRYSLSSQSPKSVTRFPGYIQKILTNDLGLFISYTHASTESSYLVESSPRCPVCPLSLFTTFPKQTRFIQLTATGYWPLYSFRYSFLYSNFLCLNIE